MKYATIALLVIGASAEDKSGEVPCAVRVYTVPDTTEYGDSRRQANEIGSITEGLCDLTDRYICNADDLDAKYAESDRNQIAEDYLNCDHFADAICNIDRQGGCECLDDDRLMYREAGNVNANFKSCHIGETIIPALKEETQVEQEACYSSQQDSKYEITGKADNKYELKGGLQQWAQKDSHVERDCTCELDIDGTSQKEFSQNGNRYLGNCCAGKHGCDCRCNIGIEDELLDCEATQVVTSPRHVVYNKVDQVVRDAISKTISKAVKFALDESMGSSIRV